MSYNLAKNYLCKLRQINWLMLQIARKINIQTSMLVAMLLSMKHVRIRCVMTYRAISFLYCGRKRSKGNISSGTEWLIKNSCTSDINCWNASSEWSKRYPNNMFIMTLVTHEAVSCLTSKGRPCFSRTLLIISSTSTKILVSITRWPNPNRFKIDRHSWWWLRNWESYGAAAIPLKNSKSFLNLLSE